MLRQAVGLETLANTRQQIASGWLPHHVRETNKEAKYADEFAQPVIWTGDLPEYLKHLSTCRAFRNILAQGPQNLLGMQDKDKVNQDYSI